MLLLDEHGDAIEADLLHFYHGVDLLDFHRGVMSARRLRVLVNDLIKRPGSSLLQALNEGYPGLSPTDNFLADLWQLTVQVHSKDPSSVPDHPVRAAMTEKRRAAAKATKLAEMKAEFDRRKAKYRKQ